MSVWIEFALYSVAPPAATALAAASLVRLIAPAGLAKRIALPLGLAAGFFVGYLILPDDRAAIVPVRHWHWLPWVGAAAVLGAISREGVTRARFGAVERWLVFAALALFAAWNLVPLWPHLTPPRLYSVQLVAAYLFLLMAGLWHLPDRLLGRLSLVILLTSAIASALLITIAVSMRMGNVGAIAAAATAGCVMAALVGDHAPLSTRSLLPAFALLVGGMAYVGAIEATPRPLVLLPSIVPLVLWLFAAGPLGRLSPRWSAAMQVTLVLMILLGVIAWVALAERGNSY
jgi:hypothetical protein